MLCHDHQQQILHSNVFISRVELLYRINHEHAKSGKNSFQVMILIQILKLLFCLPLISTDFSRACRPRGMAIICVQTGLASSLSIFNIMIILQYNMMTRLSQKYQEICQLSVDVLLLKIGP